MAPAALLSSSGASSPATSPGMSTPSLIQHEEAEGYLSGTDDTSEMHDTSTQNGGSSACPSQGYQQLQQNQEPIAIVGMSCRFPGGASSPAEFWELCSRARSGFRSGVPPERFDHEAFYHPNAGKIGTYHAQGGYFLDDDLATFDAPFFSLTEKEAVASKCMQIFTLASDVAERSLTYSPDNCSGSATETSVGMHIRSFRERRHAEALCRGKASGRLHWRQSDRIRDASLA